MNNTSNLFYGNIEDLTLSNDNYRQVIFTSPNSKTQLVLMSLKPGEEIGIEKHNEADQFIKIERGNGTVEFGKNKDKLTKMELKDGSALLIPANTWHNIINSKDNNQMNLYTIYSPAQHKDKLVQKDKQITKEQDGGSMSDDLYYKKYLRYKNKYLSIRNKC